MHRIARHWIETLRLARHPEGGWFREFYRAPETFPAGALPTRFDGPRSLATCIYFLLTGDECSALHRIRQDELWHHHDGEPLTLHRIAPRGDYASTTIGSAAGRNVTPAAVVPAGTLFGATVPHEGFALVSCTVVPGFDFADFELPGRDALMAAYPQHRALIERLTPPSP